MSDHKSLDGGLSPYQAMLSDADAPHPFELGIKEGVCLLGNPPFPDVTVLESKLVHIRSLKYQILTLDATDENQNRNEVVRIGRLVAELEGDGEVEIQRFLLPMEDAEVFVDETRCAACLMSIPEGEAKIVGCEAYHQHCYLED